MLIKKNYQNTKKKKKEMVATELILGMEELVNHIKDIEEENKKLKEENKKLKEPMVGELEDYLEMNGAEGGTIKTQHERDFYKKKVGELQKQNKKLQEEKETSCKFIGGDYDEGSAVEEILKGYYSEDFIKANKETWDYYQIFQ